MPQHIPDDKPSIVIAVLELGPTITNTYLVADSAAGKAVVIDPASDGPLILSQAQEHGWELTAVWLTHAHFDHIGGIPGLVNAQGSPVPLALHPGDLPMWQARGGAGLFGLPAYDPGVKPTIQLEHDMQLTVGQYAFQVRHTPGHSPGHVIFVSRELELVFCGDLVFMDGVGRTDLPGGSWRTLLHSIGAEILSLPDNFQLLPGHGPATSVGQERRSNPFFAEIL